MRGPVVIELPFATESLNTLMGWKHNPKTRAWKYGQHKAEIAAWVRDWIPPDRFLAKAKRMVTFTRYSAGTLDDDNLRGGFKPVVDVLVQHGVLVDDTAEWLEATYRQEKTGRGEKRTRIEIQEAT